MAALVTLLILISIYTIIYITRDDPEEKERKEILERRKKKKYKKEESKSIGDKKSGSSLKDKKRKMKKKLKGKDLSITAWRWKKGEFVKTSLKKCDAVSVPAGRSRSDKENDEVARFTKEEAKMFGDILRSELDYSGNVSKSNSGNKWTIWRISKGRWKEKRYGGKGMSMDEYYEMEKRKNPDLRHLDHPEKWIDLADDIGADPMVLKSNLD
jgi:hypothetical protein